MSWLDALPASERAALRDAGRIGASRYETDADYHEDCGYAWNRHDNRNPRNVLPFGCPDETTVRGMDGDR